MERLQRPRPMAADRPGRTEKTRAALVAAGRKLFCEHPIDAVAIDDIVREAGVAKGSFYNHFTDREALARAVTALIRADVEHAVWQSPAGATIRRTAHAGWSGHCVSICATP